MITLDGKRLETAWWGPAADAAPTLVLLHEGLGCVALWRDFPATLAAATDTACSHGRGWDTASRTPHRCRGPLATCTTRRCSALGVCWTPRASGAACSLAIPTADRSRRSTQAAIA